jgi:hypothetical protein
MDVYHVEFEKDTVNSLAAGTRKHTDMTSI